MADEPTITVTKDGPYHVRGSVPLIRQTIEADDAGYSVEWRAGETFVTGEEYELCRCGQSANKPFCDSSHLRVGFDGTETASRDPYLEQAEEEEGPVVILTDAQPLCAFSRFCDYGDKIWNLVQEPEKDAATLAIREGEHCVSGRLVVWDRDTKQPHEPKLDRSIGVVEDPAEHVSGGLWARGGVQLIGADGFRYEVRNRMALCRCGASENKPFCDGSHASIGFDDGAIPER
jgi:CDGSH-type Zn-finger protein